MVHLPHLDKLRRDADRPPAVKAEVEEEELEEWDSGEGSPLFKRFRFATAPPPIRQDWGAGACVPNPQPGQYDLLDEPSPLGLRLKKTPSLVDLIQMKLSQAEKMKDTRSAGNAGATEKLKASNFPASLLRIGAWERVSRYEGELVAKCYFAKHKLVWEVLDGGLKSKIEMQWSDISALKATCPENGPGTLDIVLSRQPLFFRETNPQPRKHTLWQATSDFTGGQASIHRRHFLQCPQGLMNKHIEKLIRCDTRLYTLSQQPDIILANPYFEPRCSVFEDPEDSKCRGFDNMEDVCQVQAQGFQELASTHIGLSRRTNTDVRELGGTPDAVPCHLPTSVLDTPVIKEDAPGEAELPRDLRNWNTFRVPGLRPSISRSEIINHIGHRLYRQFNSANQPVHGDGSSSTETFDEITRYLLNDTLISDATDEKTLMSRVNSLCCLLQRDGDTVQNLQVNTASAAQEDDNNIELYERKPVINVATIEGEASNRSLPSRQPGSIPRQESIGELLMHLPRIASFPHFL